MKHIILIIAVAFITLGANAQSAPTKKVITTVAVKKETATIKAVDTPKPVLKKFRLNMQAKSVTTFNNKKKVIKKDSRQK